MSYEYDEYLNDHIDNVNKAGQWLKRHSPIFRELLYVPYGYILSHDNSKYSTEEYGAYDRYFYGNNKSFKVVNDFNYAWLHHIHNNPHHWQYWVLINSVIDAKKSYEENGIEELRAKYQQDEN